MTSAYHFVHELTGLQTERLTELYQLEWWTRGRTLEQVTTMLTHSDNIFGMVTEEQELIGFARVLTDYVFKALVLDVIVVAEHRGEGLGRRLMEEVLGHGDLTGQRPGRQGRVQRMPNRPVHAFDHGAETDKAGPHDHHGNQLGSKSDCVIPGAIWNIGRAIPTTSGFYPLYDPIDICSSGGNLYLENGYYNK